MKALLKRSNRLSLTSVKASLDLRAAVRESSYSLSVAFSRVSTPSRRSIARMFGLSFSSSSLKSLMRVWRISSVSPSSGYGNQ